MVLVGGYFSLLQKFFYGVFGSPATINLKDTLFFRTEKLDKDKPLNIFRLNILVGYNFELTNIYSFSPYAGFLMTGFSSKEFIYSVESQAIPFGFNFGFYLNKSIELRPRRYLVIFINNNFNQSYYSKFNSALGDNYYSISFGLGYKAWFLKKIKE